MTRGADPEAPGSPRRERSVLLWILAGALVLRLVVLYAISPTPLAGDELDYFWRGAERMQGIEPADLGSRPPAMELLLGGLFRLTGASIPAARLANVVLGVLLLVPLYDVARRLAGAGVARLAAAIAAVYPNFVAFSHYLWSETVYLFLVLWGLSLIGSWVDRPAPSALWKLGLAGACLGLSALTRVVGLAFPFIAAAWLLWTARDRLRAGDATAWLAPACLLVATLLPIAPWTAHLNRVGEPFAPITRTTWLNLYVGNGEPVHGAHPVNHYTSLGETRVAREARARELVLETIGRRLPAWPFEKIASELPNFVSPTSFAVRRLAMSPDAKWATNLAWAYRFRFDWLDPPAVRNAAIVVIVGAYLVVVLAGTTGLALLPHSSWRGLLLLFVLSQIAPTLLTFAVSRFRIATMAIVIVGAAWLVRAGPEAWRRATPLAQGSAIFATGAVAGMIWLRWHQIFDRSWG